MSDTFPITGLIHHLALERRSPPLPPPRALPPPTPELLLPRKTSIPPPRVAMAIPVSASPPNALHLRRTMVYVHHRDGGCK